MTNLLGAQRLFMWLCLLSISVLTGCAGGLSQSTKQALSIVAPHDVDFAELHYYAVRSHSAYDPPETILETYPDVTRVTTLRSVDVRYFIETDHSAQTQTVSVRGTAVKPNFWQDLEISLVSDTILGSVLHGGFQKDALAVWGDAKPHLRKDYSVRVTGHSLGAAVALIVGAYADAEGYTVSRIVNFGQPKVTTEEFESRLFEVTTRVVDDRDVVPMLPPPGFAPKYRHLGPEVILRLGEDYVYLDTHDADRVSIEDFWREISHFSIKEHSMVHYLANLEYKLENGEKQVPYFLKVN